MSLIAERLQAVNTRICQSAEKAGRASTSVALLAVSKAQGAEALRETYHAGQVRFGENYVQEALSKQSALEDLPIEWHFIGPIQSNKTALIAEHFSWVHGVDRLKIAQRLSMSRPAHLPELQICIQVNVSEESSKSGIHPAEAKALALAVHALPRLRLRGLMAIPAPTHDEDMQHRQFKMVREILDDLNREGLQLDTLSMGMSEDYPVAIAEGATMVRVGSAIFGARPARLVNGIH